MKQWQNSSTAQQSTTMPSLAPAPGCSNAAYQRYSGTRPAQRQAKANKSSGTGAQLAASTGDDQKGPASTAPPTGSGHVTPRPAKKFAVIDLHIGGAEYRIAGDKLLSGDIELGTIADAAKAAESITRKQAPSVPATIDFTPDNDAAGVFHAGDLLSQATEGSTIRSGRRLWVRSGGEWHRMDGHSQITKGARKGEYAGFSKYGGGTVISVLTRLTNEGLLALTPKQIVILDAIAQVETGGQISCVQTYDNQVVSVGFKQVVLGHGSLEKLMNRAAAGFAKHGLRLDSSRKYKRQSGWSQAPHQIQGCEDAEELRTPEWAIKFYHAGMEPDVIEGQCELALRELGHVQKTAKQQAKGVVYFQDPTAEAWLLETKNNRPAFMTKAVSRAVADGAGKAASRDAFLDTLAQAIIDTYIEEEPLLAYRKAKSKKGKLSAEEDAKLLEDYKTSHGPIGKRKGTNIVTKIPRTLTFAERDPIGIGRFRDRLQAVYRVVHGRRRRLTRERQQLGPGRGSRSGPRAPSTHVAWQRAYAGATRYRSWSRPTGCEFARSLTPAAMTASWDIWPVARRSQLTARRGTGSQSITRVARRISMLATHDWQSPQI